MRYLSLVLFITLFTIGYAEHQVKAKRPNILVIVADDMGYSDVGCFGGEIATPNIDQLAKEGIKLKNFYNNAKCGPSRASLLTGQYPHKGKLRTGVTFAEVLKTEGYRTIMTGKWHQSPKPTDRGWDRYYGLTDGCCNFWNPGIEAREGEPAPGRKKQKGDKPRMWAIEDKEIAGYVPEDKGFYTTDAFTDYAVDRLEEYQEETKPFCLYLAYTAPHYPLHAWASDIKKYKDTYKVGWDVIREKRYQRMKKMGIITNNTLLSKRDEKVSSWSSLTTKEKQEKAHLMAVYAAMVDRMDQGIGRVIAKLKEIGKYDNTLILFMSDNGACAETVDLDVSVPAGGVASYRSLGQEWANASNTPYKKFKATSYEGGVKTPLIACWPNAIKHQEEVITKRAHVIDILPTLMEVAGASYPTTVAGVKKLLPMDGKSMLPILRGENKQPHEYLFWEYGATYKAVLYHNLKLVEDKKSIKGETQQFLYKLDEDDNELKNVIDQYPKEAKKMAAAWNMWWKQDNIPINSTSKKGNLNFIINEE